MTTPSAAPSLTAARAHLPWIRMGGYAFAALAILKGITFALGIEQSKLDALTFGVEAVTIVMAAFTAYFVLRRGNAKWLLLATVVYCINIVILALLEPRSIIDGFLLKAGVLGVAGLAIYHWYGLRQNITGLRAAGFSESELESLRLLGK